ncbi:MULTISPECIES: iron transporter [Tistrella]|uniref:iron transporter n=1 Tax=Tistrella TaxID=171436 RepID=UPI0031FB759E
MTAMRGVPLRLLAAGPGGYVVAALAATLCVRLLPGPAVEAVLAGTMASFLIWTGVVIRVFAVAAPVRALAEVVALACLLALAGGWR